MLMTGLVPAAAAPVAVTEQSATDLDSTATGSGSGGAAEATGTQGDAADLPETVDLEWTASDSTDEPQVEPSQDGSIAISPMSVPDPPANSAVLTVKVGGDRLADGSVQGLQGVTLALSGAGTGSTAPSAATATQGTPGVQYDAGWPWTTCVSDADGDCSFVIPIRAGAISATGVPQDTRFWVQQIGTSPAGWYSNPSARLGGFGATPEFTFGYRFRTDTLLRAGQTYRSTTPLATVANWSAGNEPDRGFMRVREDNNAEGGQAANVTRTTGVWNQSRMNPPATAKCDLDIAMVTDTSGSLGADGMVSLKDAMGAFVDAFRGTPTRMSLFSFSTTSPGSGALPAPGVPAINRPDLLPVTTAAQAATFKAQYANWLHGGGTNWDRGLAAAANSGNTYDLVILLTDGNPTTYGETPGSGTSAYNSNQDIDAGVFSANQLKAAGSRVIAVGAGPGLTPASELNLRAVSGTTSGSDYFRAANFDEAAAVLAELAGNCDGGIEVRKMIVPEGGTIAQATPAPAGWQFDASTTATGVSLVAPTTATTIDGGDGRVSFGLTFASPVTSGAVQILETQQTGFELVPVAGANAVCLNPETGAPVSVTNAGSAATPGFSVVGQEGAQLTCTIYNTPVPSPEPGFTLTKTSDPVSGTAVQGGDTITYTVTGTNTGDTILDPVVITDDLAQVLDNAELTGAPTTSVGAAPTVAGTTLTWNGTLAVGASVTLTYTVTLNEDVPAGTVVNNVASGSATPPGLPPITPPPVETEHPVPGFELTKASDPVSGTSVTGGDTITYTVTGTNTGATVLDPVVITDDLAAVLNNAELTGTPTASAGAAPSVSGTTLTWNGALAIGASVTLTYTVTLNEDVAPGTIVNNIASGSATPPGLPPITPPPVETEHPVPGLSVTKSSDPVSGTQVLPGDEIDYTLTFVNTGATPIAVNHLDSLLGALDDGTVTTAPVSVPAGALNVSAVDPDTGSFTIDGTLPVGATATVTYTVTVNGAAGPFGDGNLVNVLLEGDVPPSEPPTACEPVLPGQVACTEHPIPGDLIVQKGSTPPSGTTVALGSTITYAITFQNVGGQAVAVDHTDYLLDVPDMGSITGQPTFVGGNGFGLALSPVTGGNQFTVSGDLAGGATATVIYSVALVDELPEGSDGIFTNVVVPGDGVPPEGPCEPGDQLCTEHPTPLVPGFELTKTSDPVSGTTVVGGDTITYTVTGTNTGATVLDPVVITDDLAAVLNNAELTGTPTASAGAAPTVTGRTLTWNGSLAVGGSVTLTYTVTLDADVPAGTVINNIASGSAQPPTTPENPVPPITPPPVETEHPVPGFELTKSSDPVSGSAVQGGSTITYTVTGINTGATVLEPVVITDDLAAVLRNAELTGDPVATVNGEAAAAPILDGTTLIWTGSLAVGQSVTLTYTVTLDADVPAGTVVNNVASGSATPPGVPPITPPPAETEHPVPGFTLIKTSDPVSGTAVAGGSTITYTVTGTNTGSTVLDQVVITDDLAAVLNNAELTGTPTASLGSAPALDGTTLTWNGSLAGGATVTLTYTVTLDADIPAGTIVNNIASGSATPPGLPPITPPPVETEHPVPGFELTKTSDPVSGSTVIGGDTITYTLTGSNTGATVLDPVVITDDLAAVLNHAELTGAPVASVNGQAAAAPSVEGTTLTWTGSLPAGGVATITYTVTLDADIPAGTVVNNVASGSATPPGLPPITPPPVETEHPVPGFELTKTSDPASGSTVVGGDAITYTVTGTNTGATVLDPVVVTDDLAAVLNHAELTGAPAASVNGEVAAAPVVDGTTLTWNGGLAVGQTVTITYTVTLDADIPSGTIVNNHAEGSAQPPSTPENPVPPITPPPVETEHPVPGFELTKTSDPISGSTVVGGDTITYTVTGTNTGATVLDPVVITDDMAAVLNSAGYNGDALAVVMGAESGELVLEGTTLTWSGSLAVGEAVTITYSVTVNADAAGVVLHNHVEGSAQPPTTPENPVPPITPPPVDTEHPVPPGPTPPTTPPVTPPSTPPTTKPTPPGKPLPHTGAAVTSAGIAALALLGTGGGLLLARRRRREEMQG